MTNQAKHNYKVTAALVHPACFDQGYEYEISAANKAEAVKVARRKVRDSGWTRQDGPLKFTAVEVQS
jgi:hypothetical protein